MGGKTSALCCTCGNRKTADSLDAPTLVLHFDLNKTILAIDEVKGYGREEVVYLEQFKSDTNFLNWAYAKRGSDSGDTDAAAWIENLKTSKKEKELIAYAKEYVQFDRGALEDVLGVLAKVRKDNSVESFWRLLQWARDEQTSHRVLIVFRTYGADLLDMFARCEEAGYGDQVVRMPSDIDSYELRPLIYTVVHELEEDGPFGLIDLEGVRQLRGGGQCIVPNPKKPSEEQRNSPEFKRRREELEEAAQAQFALGGWLKPLLHTAPVANFTDRMGSKRQSCVINQDLEDKPPVELAELPKLLSSTKFDGSRLRIMGIQDNFNPWCRKNWRNGKPFVITSPPDPPHLFFDDYCFTKSAAEGTYILALLDSMSGSFIDGDKPQLQSRFSGEEQFVGVEDNRPLIFTAVLNKRGSECAVLHENYFLDRVKRSLCFLEHDRQMTIHVD